MPIIRGDTVGFASDGTPIVFGGTPGGDYSSSWKEDLTKDYLEGGLGVPEVDAEQIMDDIFREGEGNGISDAKGYGDILGSSIEDKYEWLIKNDPDNATSWMEKFLDYQSSQKSTQDAWAYSRFLDDTKVQRARADLEKAGINPILAYNYLGNSSGSVGSAVLPGANVATTATSRYNAQLQQSSNDKRTAAVVAGVIGTLVGVILKAML